MTNKTAFNYIKRLSGVSHIEFAERLKVSPMLVSYWNSGITGIARKHKDTFENDYGIPYRLITGGKKPLLDLKELDEFIFISMGLDPLNVEEIIPTFSSFEYYLYLTETTKNSLYEKNVMSMSTGKRLEKNGRILPKHLKPIEDFFNFDSSILRGPLTISKKYEIDNLVLNR